MIVDPDDKTKCKESSGCFYNDSNQQWWGSNPKQKGSGQCDKLGDPCKIKCQKTKDGSKTCCTNGTYQWWQGEGSAQASDGQCKNYW